MFCYKCGKRIPDGGSFCAFCGAEMVIPSEEVIAEEISSEDVSIPVEKIVTDEKATETLLEETSVEDQIIETPKVEKTIIEDVATDDKFEEEESLEDKSVYEGQIEDVENEISHEEEVLGEESKAEEKQDVEISMGTTKNPYQQFYGVSEQKELTVEEIAKAKKRNIITGIVLIILAVASIVVTLLNVFMKPTIDLNKYITVTAEGYDTIGVAVIKVDDEQFEKEYVKKVGNKKSKETSWKKFLSDVTAVEIDNDKDLSNGDLVILNWKNNDEKALEKYGVKLKYKDIEHTVEGLKVLEKFDPFNGVEILFSGIEPNGRAEIVEKSESRITSDFVFRVENMSGLSNGDKVTVTADMYYVDDIIEYCAEKYGMIPNSLEKTYVVAGIDRYVSSLDEISTDSLTLMQKEAEKIFGSVEIDRMGKGESFVGMDYIGNYLLSSREPGGYNKSNILYLVYKVTVNNRYEKDIDKYNKNNEYYWYISFSDLLVNSSGETIVDVAKNDTPSNRVEFDSGIGNLFAVTSWFYHGYESIDDLYKNNISDKQDKYIINDSIDEDLEQVYELEQDDMNEEGMEEIAISNIIASSELNVKAKDGSTYHVQNMIDGNPETAWIEGADGLGIGESVYMEFDGVKNISNITIYPGFLKTKNRYFVNGQPTKLLVEWDGGQGEIELPRVDVGTDEEPFELDELPVAELNLEDSVQTSYIRLTITDAIAGSKYEDVAISDVAVYTTAGDDIAEFDDSEGKDVADINNPNPWLSNMTNAEKLLNLGFSSENLKYINGGISLYAQSHLGLNEKFETTYVEDSIKYPSENVATFTVKVNGEYLLPIKYDFVSGDVAFKDAEKITN